MVSESHGKRNLPVGTQLHDLAHQILSATFIDNIACEYRQVGLFLIKHLIDTFVCHIRCRKMFEMKVGKLNYFERPIIMET